MLRRYCLGYDIETELAGSNPLEVPPNLQEYSGKGVAAADRFDRKSHSYFITHKNQVEHK